MDLSGNNALQLTVRLFSGNEAEWIQILLYDADGTKENFSFASSLFNEDTFSSGWVDFSDENITTAGTTAGLDLSAITGYTVQGNHWDVNGAKDANFFMQLDELSVGSVGMVPEPATLSFLFLGTSALLVIRRRFFA